MNHRNLPLIVGILLPVAFIVIFALVIFTPNFFVRPEHDFVYTLSNGYDPQYRTTIGVENGRIVLRAVTPARADQQFQGDISPLFLYDMQTFTSHEISLADAQMLALDPGPSSPDGYTVEYAHRNYGLLELFGSSDDSRGYFISKGYGKKKLTGLGFPGRYSYYDNSFKLIGWVQ